MGRELEEIEEAVAGNIIGEKIKHQLLGNIDL